MREKLHGRTAAGTWVQLEKTPAAMGKGFHLPSMTDVRHLMDYVVYRITKRNVGPWGLSGKTEKRPMYLSPDLGVTMPLPAAAEAGADRRAGAASRTTTTRRRPRPTWRPASRPRTARTRSPSSCSSPATRAGRGLFGASDVWVTETPSPPARELLTRGHEPPRWTLPPAPRTTRATVDGR